MSCSVIATKYHEMLTSAVLQLQQRGSLNMTVFMQLAATLLKGLTMHVLRHFTEDRIISRPFLTKQRVVFLISRPATWLREYLKSLGY